MSITYTILLCIFVLLCFLLVAAVLLQTGKGGGMAGLGGGVTDSAFGAHTANILQKFTGFCVFLFFILVILLAHNLNTNDVGENESVFDGTTTPAKEEKQPDGAAVQTPAQPTNDNSLPVELNTEKIKVPDSETAPVKIQVPETPAEPEKE